MQRIKNLNFDISFSIIVASHREISVVETVKSFERFLQKDTVEIIIVTDYDNSKLCSKFPEYRWLYLNDRSISAKRNMGINRAKNEIIGFTDDDCLVNINWIDNAKLFFNSNPSYIGVEGQTIITNITKDNRQSMQFKRLEKPGYRTNNIFYKKNVLDKIGGFDERFPFQREDSDLAFTLISKGYKIGFDKSICVEHSYRKNEPFDLLKNCYNRRFDPLLYKKHRQLYRANINTPFTLSILIMLIFSLFSLKMLIVSYENIAIYSVISYLIFPLIVMTIQVKGRIFSAPLEKVTDYISLILAPWVLLYALITGSLKNRTFLIF